MELPQFCGLDTSLFAHEGLAANFAEESYQSHHHCRWFPGLPAIHLDNREGSGARMSNPFLFQKKHLVLGSVLLLVSIVGGCRSSKQTTYSEGLSEPVDSITRTAEPKSSKVADAQNLVQWHQFADSLINRQRELERSIGDLTGRLHLAETTLESHKADALKVAMNQPDRSPRPEVRRAPDRYDEVIRQYKAASERFQELMKNGLPKDVQDQIQSAVGIAKRVDSLQIIVVNNAQLFRQDLDSKMIWIYVMMGIIAILGLLTYGTFIRAEGKRKDLEGRVSTSLSSSFSYFEEKIRQVQSEIASNAPPKQLATPKKSKPPIE